MTIINALGSISHTFDSVWKTATVTFGVFTRSK